MKYLLGIDLGTSSLKALLMDEAGKTLACAARQYQLICERPGYAEQDPKDWWNACREAVYQAIFESGVAGNAIAGVSFSGQMHGLVALDGSGKSVRNSILHCDTRSVQQVSEIHARFDADFLTRVLMNPPYTGFLLPTSIYPRISISFHVSCT